MNSMVNHPQHYSKEGRKECIEEMRELFGGFITAVFCLMNAYKYLYRAGEKEGNSESQDMQKAKWYYNYANGIMRRRWMFGRFRRLYGCIKGTMEERNGQD